MLLVLLHFKHYAYFTHIVFLWHSPIYQLPLHSQKYAETCYRTLKTTPQTNPKILTTANDSKVNTTLNKHHPSQPNVFKNREWTLQHLPLIIFNNPQHSKHYAPLYDYFFRNHNYFKELKQTYKPSLKPPSHNYRAYPLCNQCHHLTKQINHLFLQNTSYDDSQFSDRSLNLSAW